MNEQSKNSTWKKDFYLAVLTELKDTTNLTKIQKKLGISKQQLNYYLRRLKKNGLVHNPSYGLWELTKQSKNSTKYESLLKKDISRGHAYIINIIPKKLPENWKDRLKIIKKKGINYKLVGAKETTPRIKALGRKIWLCNKHIRIFDKKDESYYGLNAIESRKQAFLEFVKIINCLENKLGFSLRPFNFQWRREHYALIKNDLAIDQNKKGVIWRIKDESGEWLLIDDSLEMGGELENIGKKSLATNVKMQRWWNEYKEDGFKTTPKTIKKKTEQIEKEIEDLQTQILLDKRDSLKQDKDLSENTMSLRMVIQQQAIVLRAMQGEVNGLTQTVYLLAEEIKRMKE